MARPVHLLLGGIALGLASFTAQAADALPKAQWPFTAEPRATLDEPWAMTFLPDGTLLVTEKRGVLKHVDPKTGKSHDIAGVPEVAYGGQGGFGDVILHPDFASNRYVYISYAEAGDGDTRGAAVARAKLQLDEGGSGALTELSVIWQQTPKVSGAGHYGHRLAFGPDGKLWITSSERQKFTPAQDMKSNLGKLVRLNDDGSLPTDNPFADQGGVAAQVWSLGHRNMLGLAFDANDKLWVHEMGPAGGDELNLIVRGENYGYPEVSNGDHYGGKPIPDHDTRPEFAAPKITWNPVISPAGFVIYQGERFPGWNGAGLIGGLSSQALVRVAFDGDDAREAARYDMGARIREVEQGPDGSIWLLEDGADGRLLELLPK
ncbi:MULTISPECIES: PQQ-dependent sugar dehydrogenase [Pseudomonas]|uniref:Putative dehydrogenase n=1 Tax=Pseudomonas fulva (strain 12-X) TaxID=743720 RepID=F6AC39_PSEF1|nr:MULTISPECIES: PQQ-dependent sugar dehydrogenase [Pseudomonas]AEF21119.1 putative dehydrogenase [Pseudomonas fulva 12-X]MBV7563957.1 PQQ-dependent sugar dehydrogenase [Pseudomonas sp. sia0905]PZW68597.1 glucose/arabinose dehydrogenase [Pseudomonas sp. URMO17WK12:I1]